MTVSEDLFFTGKGTCAYKNTALGVEMEKTSPTPKVFVYGVGYWFTLNTHLWLYKRGLWWFLKINVPTNGI